MGAWPCWVGACERLVVGAWIRWGAAPAGRLRVGRVAIPGEPDRRPAARRGSALVRISTAGAAVLRRPAGFVETRTCTRATHVVSHRLLRPIFAFCETTAHCGGRGQKLEWNYTSSRGRLTKDYCAIFGSAAGGLRTRFVLNLL